MLQSFAEADKATVYRQMHSILAAGSELNHGVTFQIAWFLSERLSRLSLPLPLTFHQQTTDNSMFRIQTASSQLISFRARADFHCPRVSLTVLIEFQKNPGVSLFLATGTHTAGHKISIPYTQNAIKHHGAEWAVRPLISAVSQDTHCIDLALYFGENLATVKILQAMH